MAISRISAASARANSVAITTPQAGDLILVFAHRDGSTTAPTLPAGYTSIDSVGANTNSARIGYKYSDGTETTSGTWTNATSVAVGVYRGVDPYYPVGSFAGAGAASATLSFTGITLWAQNSSSWVVGFAGHRTATNVGTNAPTGMATRSSATDVAIFDTGGTTNSWSTQTASVSASSGWRTYTVELRTPPAVDTVPSPDYLVQHVCGNNTGWGRAASAVTAQLPNPTKAGNCLVVSVHHNTSVTISSVSDDQGNTYSLAKTVAGSGTTMHMYVAANVAAGTGTITVALSGAADADACLQIAEFYNIATSSPVDVSAGTSITLPAAIATSSMTTTQANDLVYQVFFTEAAFQFDQARVKRIVKDPTNGLVLCAADLLAGSGAQYGIKASAGAINPTMFASSTANGGNANVTVTAAIGLKTTTAGSAGSGPRIRAVQGVNLMMSQTSPIALQFPCAGNMLALSWVGYDATANAGRDLSSMSDSAGNTWSATGATLNSAGGGTVRIYYAGDATAYPGYIGPVLTTSGDVAEANGILYDLVEMATSPFDNDVTATGNQTTSGDLSTATVTPTNSSGVIIAVCGVNDHAISGLAGTGFISDSMTYPEADGSRNFYEDNGAGHFYNADTAPRTFVWTTQNNTTGVLDWAARAAAFKGAVVVTATSLAPRRAFPRSILLQ